MLIVQVSLESPLASCCRRSLLTFPTMFEKPPCPDHLSLNFESSTLPSKTRANSRSQDPSSDKQLTKLAFETQSSPRSWFTPSTVYTGIPGNSGHWPRSQLTGETSSSLLPDVGPCWTACTNIKSRKPSSRTTQQLESVRCVLTKSSFQLVSPSPPTPSTSTNGQFGPQFPLRQKLSREGLPIEGFCVAAGIPSTKIAAEIVDAPFALLVSSMALQTRLR